MENKENFKSYAFKRKKGIDDLQNTFAWVGNSQGDNSATNNTLEGQASGGWMSYMFKDININDQEAINKESIRRIKANEDYIKELKEKGEFGQEFIITLHVKHNPIFDNPNTK